MSNSRRRSIQRRRATQRQTEALLEGRGSGTSDVTSATTLPVLSTNETAAAVLSYPVATETSLYAFLETVYRDESVILTLYTLRFQPARIGRDEPSFDYYDSVGYPLSTHQMHRR
jgi:hypothetical protein